MDKVIIEKKKLYDIMAFLVIFFSMFPYLKTTPLTADIQPHVIVIFFMYFYITFLLSYNKFTINNYVLSGIGIVAMFFVSMLWLDAGALDYVRILFFFFSFFLLIEVYNNSSDIIHHAVSISIIIYFLGALGQIIFGLSVLDPFVSNLRFSDSRGLTSFASEPSFFGLVSLAQIIILEIMHKKKFRFFQFVALLSLLFSGSLFVILPASIIFIFYFVRARYAIIYIAIFSLLGIGMLSILSMMHPDFRAVKLTNTLLSNPEVLLNDVSMLNRLLRSFGPIYLSFVDYFQPHNFIYTEQHLSCLIDYFDKTDDLRVDRLSNVTTYLIYPFGYMGATLILYYLYKLYKFRVPLFVFFTIIYYGLANITIITPYATLLFALTFVHYKIPTKFYVWRHGKIDWTSLKKKIQSKPLVQLHIKRSSTTLKINKT